MTLIRNIIGYSFIALGVIGLFVPILQGIALILIGLAIINNPKIRHTFIKIYHGIKKRKLINKHKLTKKYKR